MSNDFIGSIDGPTHLAVVQENERLRQRVAELEAEIVSYAYKPAPDDIEYAIKDAERLEFVIKNFIRAGSVHMSGKHAWTGRGRLIGYGNNPREAIDAAMEKGEPL